MSCCHTAGCGIHESECRGSLEEKVRRQDAWARFQKRFSAGTRVRGRHPRGRASVDGRLGTVIRTPVPSVWVDPGPFAGIWVRWDDRHEMEAENLMVLASWVDHA